MPTIKHRRNLKANWESVNPVLAAGELGMEIGANGAPDRFKLGNGVSTWSQLKYFINESEIDVDTGRLSEESLDARYVLGDFFFSRMANVYTELDMGKANYRPLRVAVDGDSRIGNPDPQNDGHANDDVNRIDTSILMAACAFSKGRLLYAGNFGVSGQTTSQIAARAAATAAAAKAKFADVVLIMTGANDDNNMTLYRNKLLELIWTYRDAFVEPVLLLNTPTGNPDGGLWRTIRQRNLVMKRLGVTDNVRVIDVFDAITDDQTGTFLGYGQAGLQYAFDPTHPNANGNMVIGETIADELCRTIIGTGYYGPEDQHDQTGMVLNPMFNNDSESWVIDDYSNGGMVVSYDYHQSFVGKTLKITRSAGTAGFLQVKQDLPNNAWAVGDRLGMSCKFLTDGLPGGPGESMLKFEVRFLGGSGGETQGLWLSVQGNTTYQDPNGVGTFAYESVVPAGTTQVAIRFQVSEINPNTSKFCIGEVMVRNHTRLALA